MKRFTIFTAVLMALIMCLSTAGCGTAQTTSTQTPSATVTAVSSTTDASTAAPTTAAPTAAPTTAASTDAPTVTGAEGKLVMWYWDNATFKKLFEEFQKTNPNVTCDFIDVSAADYATKWLTSFAAGTDLPDVGALEIGYRQKLLDVDGAWEVLTKDPYNYDPNITLDYIVPLLKNSKGEITCLDGYVMASGVAYKRKVTLEMLGTDNPEALEAMLNNWDAVIAKGKEVYEKSGGKKYLFSALEQIATIVNGQRTKPIISADGTIDKAVIKEMFTLYARMKENHVYDPEVAGWDPVWKTTTDNDHLLYACAPWCPRYVIKAYDPDRKADWGVMKPPGGGFSWGGLGLSVSSKSQYKLATWKFIEFAYLSMAGEGWMFKNAGEIPSLKEFANNKDNFAGREDPYFAGQNTFLKFIEVANDMKIQPLSKYDSAVNAAMGTGQNALTLEDHTVDELVDIVVTELQTQMAAMK